MRSCRCFTQDSASTHLPHNLVSAALCGEAPENSVTLSTLASKRTRPNGLCSIGSWDLEACRTQMWETVSTRVTQQADAIADPRDKTLAHTGRSRRDQPGIMRRVVLPTRAGHGWRRGGNGNPGPHGHCLDTPTKDVQRRDLASCQSIAPPLTSVIRLLFFPVSKAGFFAPGPGLVDEVASSPKLDASTQPRPCGRAQI